MAERRTVLSVVGTRPNMMKIAPIAAELGRRGDEFEHVLVHTGQHYDREMSQIFLEELGVGEPDYLLNVGSGSHAQQTAAVMERLEPVLLEAEPHVVVVPGDMNSTLAAALAAAIVEFTSPGTRTTSGSASSSTGSSRSITAAVCWACEPEPTPSE